MADLLKRSTALLEFFRELLAINPNHSDICNKLKLIDDEELFITFTGMESMGILDEFIIKMQECGLLSSEPKLYSALSKWISQRVRSWGYSYSIMDRRDVIQWKTYAAFDSLGLIDHILQTVHDIPHQMDRPRAEMAERLFNEIPGLSNCVNRFILAYSSHWGHRQLFMLRREDEEGAGE